MASRQKKHFSCFFFMCFSFLFRNSVIADLPPCQLPEHHVVWLKDLFKLLNNFDTPIHRRV